MSNKTLSIKPYQSTMIAVYRDSGSVIMRTICDDSTDSRASLERWIERYYERKAKSN